MKKYSVFFVLAIALTLTSKSFASFGGEVSEKVASAFKQTFPSAENVEWQALPDRYVAHFEEKNILTVVEYDKDANLLNSKRYYKEDNLPVIILSKIRKKYAGKKIFSVTEVATESNVDYYIKIEDDSNWITLKSDVNGRFEVVEKYKKQS